MSHLSSGDSISLVRGIGTIIKEKLDRLGISTVGDLLRHFPSRYLDFTKQVNINEIQKDTSVSFLATIDNVKTFYSKNNKLITSATAQDNTGKISLTWFNNLFIKRTIIEGELYSIAGTPSFFGPHITLISPVIELGNSFSLNTQGLVPVYPQTAGITSRWLRKKIFELLDQTKTDDPLEKDLLQRNGLITYNAAIHQIHFPKSAHERWQADKRLSFNEHLRINLKNRLELLKLGKSISIKPNKNVDRQTKAKLPWTLTVDQQKTVSKIYSDLQKNEFTHRLIQGETGSGKTATLVFAANQSLYHGLSCAILAPTEVLATQHFQTFQKYSLFPKQISLITSSSVILARQSASGGNAGRWSPKGEIYKNSPTLFIGTHALFSRLSSEISPPLAFVAVDEQHKFGVAQRDLLLQRSPVPHLLNLSATPIPRTVALGLLGDISTSNIRHQPMNRLPTKTFVISPTKFKDSPGWLIKELEAGNQIFVVCPNITTQSGTVSSVENMAKIYRQMIPSQFPLWSIHGRLDSVTQKSIIDRFKATRSSLLVATSLIEVGIDIPKANIMIIHSAERFGLAQLHQLRGRVGRGEGQGYCFLVPTTEDGVEIERLQLLKKYHSGMILAKKDLRLRGAGEVFGFKQHGALPTRLGYFWSKNLFTKAKTEARVLVKQNPILAASVASQLITW